MLDMSSMFMNICWELAKVFYCCWVNYLVDDNYICLIKCIVKCKIKQIAELCVYVCVCFQLCFYKVHLFKEKKSVGKGSVDI